jgi:cytochrome oxidase Cu insertion factor (SCO1/SenC/PrrC family)
VSGIPPDVPTRVANLMGLQPAPREKAPGFTLTDQVGKTVSLSAFRGHAVVLTFMDDRCHTICPIVSHEFVVAEQQLARTHPGVVFLAVNVNKHALGVATVALFSTENRLTTIPTWQFLTGPLGTLRRIWREYGIEVGTKIVNGKLTTTVTHSSIIYFVSPSGTERYLATPRVDYGKTKTHRAFLPSNTVMAWAKGIALVASGLSR